MNLSKNVKISTVWKFRSDQTVISYVVENASCRRLCYGSISYMCKGDTRVHDWGVTPKRGDQLPAFDFQVSVMLPVSEKSGRKSNKKAKLVAAPKAPRKIREECLFGQIWVSVMLPFCNFEVSVMLEKSFSKIWGQPPNRALWCRPLGEVLLRLLEEILKGRMIHHFANVSAKKLYFETVFRKLWPNSEG